jgi:AraC-like DNA-binding protein/quercetin dioxygenase-like cupin family protein
MHKRAKALHESPKTEGERGLELVAAGAYAAPQGKDYPPHQHTVWEVVYYREGNIRCPIGDAVYIGQPGTVLATPPGTVHAEIARTAYANFFIQIAAPTETPWPVLAYDDAAGTFGHLCAALVREMREQASNRDALTALLLAQLDIHLRRRSHPVTEDSEAERIVRQAERLIEERNAEPLRIAEVARTVGVSPSTLRAYFTERRGVSPRDYLRAARARRAIALLRTSDLTLDAVAHLTGYDSASHLSRHVRQVTGVSPGMLRRG